MERYDSKGTAIPTPVATENADLYTKVGVYEGAGYTQKDFIALLPECRMKINEAPAFCPVCQRALERLINFLYRKIGFILKTKQRQIK